MQKWLGNIFLFFAFFSYLTPIPLFETDIQPYYLVFGGLFLVAAFPKKVPLDFLILILTAIVATLLLVYDAFTYNSIRSYVAYVGLFVAAIAFYKYFTKYGIPYKFIEVYVYIMLSVAAIQMFVSRYFFSSFVGSMRTSLQRGVTSVFAEPTHYGMICLFSMLIILLIDHPKKKWLMKLLVFQIVFFAISSQTILFLMAWLFIYIFLYKLNAYGLSIFVTIVVALFFSFESLVEQMGIQHLRFVNLFSVLKSEGLYILIRLDTSVSDRVAHVFFSFKGAVDNFFFPRGFDSWFDFLADMRAEYRHFFSAAGDSKIMSSMGAILFELGIMGVPLIWLFYKNVSALSIVINRNPLELMLIFFFIFITAVQLTLPLYAFLIGYGSWLTNHKKLVLF